ncbi:2-oxo-4-hydroxy-4-carboxy-5-ureidoimidazoline decarboxylase [Paucibacter sp. Y2R2-4]|uniref:2-oxo-4-hydroxy-4-carboxy-5-ureidoimidazoline decarboxylase n=1 Tax=Paucibacter sp. Y2R2-4 TaxID=2893553 RepID=UPI0021E4AC7E|nr:2-oxo-4-hydroxy-4-carboxy-5-ureidoimidazoline decarboxylase [Paucibacter sp. Y2R2-4]MCV2352311.1 2-oxo-4-hydroxy-4-carboxy-5-ureidoimidazoline decarboxylase [Paucibacter sp. Y2R2-4]
MTLSLSALNAATPAQFTELLAGTYEHSPWIAERAAAARPFQSLAQLKHGLAQVVREASREEQLQLIRAHPELAGKAMVAQALTAESSDEQGRAGLTHCTPEEFARLQQLNADYSAHFGWPFILAVRGPRGLGLSRSQIIEAFARRLQDSPEQELGECLRQIHRIAEIRLNDKFGVSPDLGNLVWDWAEALAQHSDPGYQEQGELTVTYLTPAHQACAAQLREWMLKDCGFDEVSIDAVGNVVGRFEGHSDKAPSLLTGSHYDTVRHAGKYDGRLGVLVPMACVRELSLAGQRLPFAIEVVAFAEEEGQRYKATFLGSSALTGSFDPAWLDEMDEQGIAMREAMRSAGLPGEMAAIQALARDPAHYLGFVEVHIEQGPVLQALDLPLGIVTSINGSVRYLGEVIGQAAHAGTTPMGQRQDAAAAVAELLLYVEQRAAEQDSTGAVTVGTVGQLQVPQGSINVIPGRCQFSLDLRASSNAARDALDGDVRAELARICQRRGLRWSLTPTMAAKAAPSDARWQARWEAAVASLGLPLHQLPSGAGHDAMKLHDLMTQAMLFVRGGNSGISHNPLESISNDDADLSVRAFQALLNHLAEELSS